MKGYTECVLITIHHLRLLMPNWFYSPIVEYRMHKRVTEQFDACMARFLELIPQDLGNIFNERELKVS
jgi:hypothetical protein